MFYNDMVLLVISMFVYLFHSFLMQLRLFGMDPGSSPQVRSMEAHWWWCRPMRKHQRRQMCDPPMDEDSPPIGSWWWLRSHSKIHPNFGRKAKIGGIELNLHERCVGVVVVGGGGGCGCGCCCCCCCCCCFFLLMGFDGFPNILGTQNDPKIIQPLKRTHLFSFLPGSVAISKHF